MSPKPIINNLKPSSSVLCKCTQETPFRAHSDDDARAGLHASRRRPRRGPVPESEPVSPGRRVLVGRRGRGRGHGRGGVVGRVVVGSDAGRLGAVEEPVEQDPVGGERGRAGAQRGPVLEALPVDAPRGQRRHRLRLRGRGGRESEAGQAFGLARR